MRKAPNLKANRYRVRQGPTASQDADGNNGQFFLPREKGSFDLLCQVSDGAGWDHVSVSVPEASLREAGQPRRLPTWDEMMRAKRLFWADDEEAVQIAPPEKDYVNQHPWCLHWWRSQEAPQPLPASPLVGWKNVGPDRPGGDGTAVFALHADAAAARLLAVAARLLGTTAERLVEERFCLVLETIAQSLPPGIVAAVRESDATIVVAGSPANPGHVHGPGCGHGGAA